MVMFKFFCTIFCISVLSLSAAFAKTSKEIWLEFSNKKNCKMGFCAEKIPAKPLALALIFFKEREREILNKNVIAILDFRKPSTEERLFLLNMKNGSVESMLVTHGKNSEGRLAMAEKFSNELGSGMSSLGFYLTHDEHYYGKHGISLRMEGLSPSNSNAFERAIVIHGADYAAEWFIKEKGRLGLSLGCPAVARSKINKLIETLKGRSLLFIYADLFTPEN